jgi:Protein of unknown function (DUF4230)
MGTGGLMSARRALLPWLLFAAATALAVWALWPGAKADVLGTTLTAFEKQNRLTVFSAQLSPVVAANDEQLLGLLKTRQIAVIPARVDYSVDLSAMSRERLRWDAEAKRLDVLLPPVAPGVPNLDEARAQYLREGVWISRTTQDKLTRENTEAAQRQASQEAVNPVLLGLARAAAKDAVRQNLSIPLAVAGYGDVTVQVRFDGEKETP